MRLLLPVEDNALSTDWHEGHYDKRKSEYGSEGLPACYILSHREE